MILQEDNLDKAIKNSAWARKNLEVAHRLLWEAVEVEKKLRIRESQKQDKSEYKEQCLDAWRAEEAYNKAAGLLY